MANVSWTIKHYNRAGNGINANYGGYSDFGTTNTIHHAFGRSMQFALNSFDTCSFGLYLDDPMAAQISRMRSFIKVWRTVRDDGGGVLYQDPANQPCFAGVVGAHAKSGGENTMSVTAYSALWILKFRFHVLNHYLKTNPDTGQLYKQSELMYKLISLTNGAFNIADPTGTGIEEGNFTWAGEPTVAPYFQAKGSFTWTHIFDSIMARAGGVDIIPRYYHSDGSPTLMFFDTAQKRGVDRSGSVNFRFHTGTNDNLDDLTEEVQAVPGEFGNYLWSVGHGGPNSGKIAMERHDGVGFGSDGISEIGARMVRKDYPDEKRLGLPKTHPNGPTHLRAHAVQDLAISKVPQTRYTIAVGKGANYWYGSHFAIGDVVRLDANKHALVVSNVKQRIYECGLNISENNMEESTPLIAHDFTGKVADT